ncbi:MAG: hypothetical protein ACMVY4_04170 [Minwuia sp.]|uniref:hypothetical protein n=1 Tax=Minwuia sp. TaxID=2493630 RepID=UPI003A898318
MSDATAQTPAEARQRALKSANRTTFMIFTVMLLLLPIAPSTFTVVAVFMAPTWMVAFYRSFHAPGAIPTVAGMNVAGTLPALHYLWTHGNDFDTAFGLLFNTDYVIMAIGAAALGIALLFIAPFVARTWVDMAGQRLLHQAQAERDRLLDEWGEELLAEPKKEDKKKGEKDERKGKSRDKDRK